MYSVTVKSYSVNGYHTICDRVDLNTLTYIYKNSLVTAIININIIITITGGVMIITVFHFQMSRVMNIFHVFH